MNARWVERVVVMLGAILVIKNPPRSTLNLIWIIIWVLGLPIEMELVSWDGHGHRDISCSVLQSTNPIKPTTEVTQNIQFDLTIHMYIQLLTLPINYYIRVPFQHIIGTLYPPMAAASSCATLPQLANRKENTKIVKKQLNFNYNWKLIVVNKVSSI